MSELAKKILLLKLNEQLNFIGPLSTLYLLMYLKESNIITEMV